MKKVGVVVDNYKVARVKKELEKANFSDYTVVGNLTPDTTVITINVEDNQVNKIGAIVSVVEAHFKRSN